MKNNKVLGQHWLKNRAILEEIAEEAAQGSAYVYSEKPSEKLGATVFKVPVCLEIGPGLGFLTSSLLRRFKKVVAVEYDAELAKKLPGSFPGKNLEVVNQDILKYDFGSLGCDYVVVGNIPYYITSPIIEKVLTCSPLPKRVVLLIQKEVAERILSKRETVLSLFVKNWARVLAGPVVAAAEFTPPPKVNSQVIIMEPLLQPQVGDEVFELIKKGFKMPRKKLVHNLAGVKPKEELKRILAEIAIPLDSRPSDLSLDDWSKLYRKLS